MVFLSKVFFLESGSTGGHGFAFSSVQFGPGEVSETNVVLPRYLRRKGEGKGAIDRNDLSLLLLQFEEGPRGIS